MDGEANGDQARKTKSEIRTGSAPRRLATDKGFRSPAWHRRARQPSGHFDVSGGQEGETDLSGTPSLKAKSLFRVTYRDGSTFTTTAKTSVLAELKANQKRPGPILNIRFIKKVTNG